MIRFFRITTFFLILLFLITTKTLAQSNYVLPYPSGMPGNFSYKIHLIYEAVSRYWYFGDFGQFNYNLKMADKYLVEAKTLFEYKQYLLGYKALKKSNQYFTNILPNLVKAEVSGKNILQKKAILDEASRKHIEILNGMQIDAPDMFNWQPEKALPTTLDIKSAIENAVNIRKSDL